MDAIHVPIKINSERVANKTFAKFGDSNLLESFFCMLRETSVSVYIDTSDELVGSKARQFGFTWLERPRYLDTNSFTGNNLLRRVQDELAGDNWCQAHITSPFLKSETILRGFEALRTSDFASIVAVREIYNRLWFQGQAVNHDLFTLSATQSLEPVLEEANLYFVRASYFRANSSRVSPDFGVLRLSDLEAYDIDTVEDLRTAQLIQNGLIQANLSLGHASSER